MVGPTLIVLRTPRLQRLGAQLVAAGAAARAVVELDDPVLLRTRDHGPATVLLDADGPVALSPDTVGRARGVGRWLIALGSSPLPFEVDERLPWPLDLDQLDALAARGTCRPRARAANGSHRATAARPADAGTGPRSRESAPTPATVLAEEGDSPGEECPPTEERPWAEGHGGRVPEGPRSPYELTAIESILRGVDPAAEPGGGPKVPAPPRTGGLPSLRRHAAAPLPLPRRDAPSAPPRTAFLRTSIQPSEASGPPVPEPVPGPAQPPSAGPSPMELFHGHGPLLSAEELEAFFAPDPVAEPASHGPESAAAAPATAAESPTATAKPEDAPDGGASLDSAPAPLPANDLGPVQLGDEDASALAVGEERPAWLKAQIADLADIVQALDLRARLSHAHTQIGDDLARLRQFTRTLGFVAAPPRRGEQTFDLASFVEEHLGEAAGRTPDAPRLLFRRRGAASTEVCADKSLLVLAFDALLETALACSDSGDVVRVAVTGHATELDGPREVTLHLDFPRGPLENHSPADLLRPYALRAVLPTIGANAIPAAGSIVVGQGGDLVVEEISTSRFAFLVTLPQGQ